MNTGLPKSTGIHTLQPHVAASQHVNAATDSSNASQHQQNQQQQQCSAAAAAATQRRNSSISNINSNAAQQQQHQRSAATAASATFFFENRGSAKALDKLAELDETGKEVLIVKTTIHDIMSKMIQLDHKSLAASYRACLRI